MSEEQKKYVVVGGNISDDSGPELIFSIGAFDDVRAAYGEALLFLMEFAEASPKEKQKISVPSKLEGETGYGLYLLNAEGKATNYTYILFNYLLNHQENESEENNNG